MPSPSRPRLARALLPFCILLLLSCSDKSPTAPANPRANIDVLLAPGFVDTSEAALVVHSELCSCTKVPVTVSINGTMAGTVACGETASFAYPASTGRVEFTVTSPEIYTAQGSLLVGGSAATPLRFQITLTCAKGAS